MVHEIRPNAHSAGRPVPQVNKIDRMRPTKENQQWQRKLQSHCRTLFDATSSTSAQPLQFPNSFRKQRNNFNVIDWLNLCRKYVSCNYWKFILYAAGQKTFTPNFPLGIFLPRNRNYYKYHGSYLVVPPCPESVTFFPGADLCRRSTGQWWYTLWQKFQCSKIYEISDRAFCTFLITSGVVEC